MLKNTSKKPLKPSCLGVTYPSRKDNTYPSRKDRGWSIRKDTNKYFLTIDFNNNPPLPPLFERGEFQKHILKSSTRKKKINQEPDKAFDGKVACGEKEFEELRKDLVRG